MLKYAIGIAKPVSIFIETFRATKIPEEEISKEKNNKNVK